MPPDFVILNTDTVFICVSLPLPSEVEMMDTTEAVLMTIQEVIVPGPNEGQNTITWIWTAVDSCDNSSSHSHTIIWQPVSAIECAIYLPASVECNEHGVIINSLVTGAQVHIHTNGRCRRRMFYSGRPGTPQIEIYIGWDDVKIS